MGREYMTKRIMALPTIVLLLVAVGCVSYNSGEYYIPAAVYENYNTDDNYVIEDDLIVEDTNDENTLANQNQYADEEDYILELDGPDFNSQVQGIQMNPEPYLGRTIRFEGMFFTSYWEEDEAIFLIARGVGGGCCGAHGFEVYLNDFPRFEDGTWVTVTGVLEEFYVPGTYRYFLRLNVTSLIEH